MSEEIVKLKKKDKVKDKIIEVYNVTKQFDGVTVVDDMNLSINKGEFVTLLGPSGCGKTTLLRMIAGFESPTSGKIFMEGVDMTSIPSHKRKVNTVFQKYALFPHLSVYGNIAFGLKLKKVFVRTEELPPKKKVVVENGEKKEIVIPESREIYRKFTKAEIDEKVSRALKMVNLEDYGHRNVNSLSGGQQQRVAIARALVCEPEVLLLDEPLGALDLKMRKEMQIELMDMHKNLGITFVYVTHDQEEALTMSDTVVIIKDGVVQQVGTPKKVYEEPANAFVADFIGESNILSGVMLANFSVKFCSHVFECTDKGFAKNEPVDLVIRPEDIYIMDADNEKGQLVGEVISSIYKGVHYEMEVLAGDYQWTIQSTASRNVGEHVSLYVTPNDIHIMKKHHTINEFITTVTSENTVDICGNDLEFCNLDGFVKGDSVKATIAFDKVELLDDESDGMLGGNVAQSLYKGNYYQVQVYTDDDDDFYLDTVDEWDIGDRVGIKILPEDIKLERYEEVANGEEESAHEA